MRPHPSRETLIYLANTPFFHRVLALVAPPYSRTPESYTSASSHYSRAKSLSSEWPGRPNIALVYSVIARGVSDVFSHGMWN
jgi:hypothetical protein